MAKGSGLTRGDRRRNERIAGLRAVVPGERAVLGVDLGEDKQVAALVDHDGRVLARRVVKRKVHQLGGLLGWVVEQAQRAGFAGVTVACEPTGHRWKALMGLADAAGMGFVCVQSLAVHRSREGEDYTRDKTDHRDAVLIGRLVTRLDCYLPERADECWARLRHLGARRFRLVAEQTACMQQIADLLGCAWPAALGCVGKPLESTTWLSCLGVIVDRCAGDLGKIRSMGKERFLAAVRRELPRWGGKRVRHRVLDNMWVALTDRAGVLAQRRGVLERVGMIIDDWRSVKARLADVHARMIAVLDELGLANLVSSIDGLSTIGAACLLAETGDLSRFSSARSVVKHAGLNPTENTSATMRGTTSVSRRGRPQLRTAAWRAAWGAMPHNAVMAAKYAHLSGRNNDRLKPGQARVACAAALLRWLYAVVTRRQPWDAAIASGAAAPGAAAQVAA